MPITEGSAEQPISPDSFTTAQEKAVDRVISVINGADVVFIETHKATTAFFERLLLVNSGTISLIITVGSAALLTSQHPLTLDAGLRHRLLVGCYLLLWSLLCCLVHNYLLLPGLGSALASRFLIDLGINVKAVGAILPGTVKVSDHEKQFKRGKLMGTLAAVITYMCGGLGLLAQVLTVTGYFKLVNVLGTLLISTR